MLYYTLNLDIFELLLNIYFHLLNGSHLMLVLLGDHHIDLLKARITRGRLQIAGGGPQGSVTRTNRAGVRVERGISVPRAHTRS
jgi:hypothetical protein